MKYLYTTFILALLPYLANSQNFEEELGTPVEGVEIIQLEELSSTSEVEQQAEVLNDFIPVPDTESEFNGATKGNFSVSLTGGATYSLPIAVPPGINGVEPQIALTYNSQAGNGLAGYGWNIAGLSSISRVGSNKYYDGKTTAVKFDSDDRFMLDGQRLILKSGKYGADGSEYELENKSNVRVFAYGYNPQGNGPESFKVLYSDGTEAYYGKQYHLTQSILQASPATRTNTVYALTYITNPQDIVISYRYILDGEGLRISNIVYGEKTQNPLTTPFVGKNRVVFKYKNRNRLEEGYTGGKRTVVGSVLDYIEVYGFGGKVRTYQLTHNTTSLGYERLTKIEDISSDGSTKKEPVTFSYGGDPNIDNTPFEIKRELVNLNIPDLNSDNYISLPGKFNKSENLGLLVHPKEGNKLFIFDDLSGTENYMQQTFDFELSQVLSANFYMNHINQILPFQGWTTASGIENGYSFKSYLKSPSSTINLVSEKTILFPKEKISLTIGGIPTIIQGNTEKDFFVGDFNGDGKQDLLAYTKENKRLVEGRSLYIFPSFFDSSNQTINYSILEDMNWNNKLTGNILIGDVDGDGIDDIINYHDGKINVFSYDATGNSPYVYSPLKNNITYEDIDIQEELPVFLGDFNGDGKTDLVTPKGNRKKGWLFFISEGNDFEKRNGLPDLHFYYSFKQGDNDYQFSYIFNDFNLDGKTDMCSISVRTGTSTVVNYFENINLNESEVSFQHIGPNFNYNFIQPKSIFTTFYHDQINHRLELAVAHQGKISLFHHKKNNTTTQRLTRIIEHDITTNISYDYFDKSHLDDSSKWEDEIVHFTTFSEEPEVYPKQDIDIMPSAYMVKKVTYTTGGRLNLLNPVRRQLFTYADPKVTYDGRGFLGFKGRMVTNVYLDVEDQIRHAEYYDVDNKGLLLKSYTGNKYHWQTFLFEPTNFLSKTVNEYNTSYSPKKVFKSSLTKTTSIEGLSGVQTEITTTYDTYNNPLVVTETKSKGSESSALQTTFTYFNSTSASNYYIGRLKSKLQKVNNIRVSYDTYTYNNNLLSSIAKRGSSGSPITESNLYDSFGNVTKKTISASDISPRVVEYTYDASGRFIIKSKDVEGLETNYTYNTATGWLLSETDPYNRTASYTYNPLGRMISETDYLGNTTEHNSLKIGNLLGVKSYKNKVISPDGIQTETITNRWGNKIKESVTDIEGEWIHTSYSYDTQSRLLKQSEPYKDEAGLWTTFEYDEYGRLKKSTLPTGKQITVSYNGLITTTNDGVKTRSETLNVIGKTKRVVDNGQTINYNYNSNGTLKNTNYGGYMISFAYDLWGRKIQMTDPSAGTYTYQYNSIGDLLQETTPNGTTTNTYDATGKITSSVTIGDSNSSITYTYNTDKMLSKVESQQGDFTATETYTYDNYKRLKKKVDQIADYGVTYDYTYDNLGRVLTESKKVQNTLQMNHTVKVKRQYKNGYLWKLTDANTSQLLKEYNSFNARGQVTEFTLGNGLKTIHTYNDYGYLITNEVNKANGTELFTLSYSWDVQRGNLTWRQTNLFKKITNPYYNEPLSESFTYDSFDRLVSSTGYWGMRMFEGGIGFPGQPTLISNVVYRDNNNYDGRGRITENKVGEYSYNSSKMYQLAQIDNMPQDQLTYYQQNPLQQVTYNARKAPLSIMQQGKENIYFDYDGFDNRRFMYYGNEGEKAQSPKMRYYSAAGDVEIDYNSETGHTQLTIYVDGSPYDASIIVRKETNSPAAYHYLHRNYLGSILAITNSAGNIDEKRHFDAWGNVMFMQTGQNQSLLKLTFLDRGYTGHEHLQGVGLINMNARLYDPKLRRFLAPDNFIQDPSNSQNYNRYGYVWNNPLRYNDESGEWVHIAIGAVIGGFTNWVTHGAQFNAKGLGYFGIGAGVGALAAFTGGGMTSVLGGGSFMAGAIGTSSAAVGGLGFVGGAIVGGSTGALSGFALTLSNNLYDGNSFSNSFERSLKSALISGTTSAITAGLISGFTAKNQGLNFWTGEGSSYMLDTGTYLTDSKGSVEYSNESLEKFVKSHSELNKYYSEMVDNLTINTPPGYKFNERTGLFFKYNTHTLKRDYSLGVATREGIIFKKINVYISKKAFISSAQLYMTTQHEFFHAYFYYHGSNYSNNQQHAIINQWEYEQYNIWKNKAGILMPKLLNPYGDAIRGAGLGIFREYWRYGFRTINHLP